jgi:hypothetical protein
MLIIKRKDLPVFRIKSQRKNDDNYLDNDEHLYQIQKQLVDGIRFDKKGNIVSLKD